MINTHRRTVAASPERVWEVLAGVGSPGDRLFPREWGSVEAPEGLRPGAPFHHRGMHCRIEAVEPERRLWIAFPPEHGGEHGFTLTRAPGGGTTVTHTLHTRPRGIDRVLWHLAVGSIHNAVIEAVLDNLERTAGDGTLVRTGHHRHRYAHLLRKVAGRSRKRAAKVGGAPDSALQRLLPVYDFRSDQRRRIHADPERVWAALESLTPDELPITRALLRLRSAGRPRSMAAPFAGDGPIPTLVREEGREVVCGKVGQPWHLHPVTAPIPVRDPDAFAAFADPGWVKAAMSIRVDPDGDATVLSAETRVRATDAAARRIFAWYWLFIRMGGAGFIRLEMLRAVARRAEQAAPA
ncbi:SRPBCC family protein [Embleya sp. NPDC008237]|uniref:SRPBCC family protein n=1 Tax=Embleya sp. NPDC008237 TaxID=3363978 RepID=UPI0036EB1474